MKDNVIIGTFAAGAIMGSILAVLLVPGKNAGKKTEGYLAYSETIKENPPSLIKISKGNSPYSEIKIEEIIEIEYSEPQFI